MTPLQQQTMVLVRQRLDAKKQAQEEAIRSASSRHAGQQDSLLTQAWKYPAAALRGTGEGIAALADMPGQAIDYTSEVAKNAWEEAHGRPYERKAVVSPIADMYNANMPAPPAGYETTNDVASVLGPAVVETALTAGAGAPAAFAQAGVRGVAKQALKAAANNIARTGIGVAGSEAGGAVGQELFGDVGREIGSFGGSLLTGPGLKTAGKGLVSGSEMLMKEPVKAALGAGGLSTTGAGLHYLGVDPKLAALLAAAVPVAKKSAELAADPAAAVRAAMAAAPAAVVSSGAGQIYDTNPYLPHINKGAR